jgi:hypothetical protein
MLSVMNEYSNLLFAYRKESSDARRLLERRNYRREENKTDNYLRSIRLINEEIIEISYDLFFSLKWTERLD